MQAGGRMRRMWCRLRAMLGRVVDGGARDAELSEELRAFVEHDTESKIFFRDIRFAMRSVAQARGFSLSVIGNLSLGLAATIVAFAFINGALLRPFPGVRDQDRLVTLGILERTPFGSRLPLTAMADYRTSFAPSARG